MTKIPIWAVRTEGSLRTGNAEETNGEGSGRSGEREQKLRGRKNKSEEEKAGRKRKRGREISEWGMRAKREDMNMWRQRNNVP